MSSGLFQFLDSTNRVNWRADAWIFWEAESDERLVMREAWGFGQQNVSELESRWQGNVLLLQQTLQRKSPIRASARMTLKQGTSKELDVVACPILLPEKTGVLQLFFSNPNLARQIEQTGISPVLEKISAVWESQSGQDSEQDSSLLTNSTEVDWQEKVSQIFTQLPESEQVSALLDLLCLNYRLARCSLFESWPRLAARKPVLLGISGVSRYEPRSPAFHFLQELAGQLEIVSGLKQHRLENVDFVPTQKTQGVTEYWTLPVLISDQVSVPEKLKEEASSVEERACFLLLETDQNGLDQEARRRLVQDWPGWKIAFSAQSQAAKSRKKTGSGRWTSLALVSGLALILAIPIPLTIQASGYYWPAERVNLFSPESGVILADDLLLPADRQVQSGQLLLTITSRELELEIGRTEGELATVSEQIRSLRSVRPERPGETGNRQTVERDVSIKLAELASLQTGLQQKRDLLKVRQQELKLSSPLSGEILTWDARLQLSGRPVSRGSLLLTIGKVNQDWDVLAEVRDRDLGYFKQALQRQSETNSGEADPGQVRIRSHLAGVEETTGTVQVFSPVVEESSPGIYSARVQIRVHRISSPVRPGTRVTVLADAGRYPAGYVWFRHLWESCQRFFVW